MINKIGIIGLSTMGRNLALNFASKGIETVCYNRSVEKTNELENSPNIIKAFSIKEFCDQLGPLKVILLLVKAGDATNATLDLLKPLLDENDIIIDLGNANYKDSTLRQNMIPNYYVCGISGGAKGARDGASMMLSGNVNNKENLLELLGKVSASDFEGLPTVEFLGEGVEGNVVKTVHNGIEYSQLQILSEIYSVLKYKNSLNDIAISTLFKQWSLDKKDYILEMMAQALETPNLLENTKPIIESKGTGKWTAQMALEENIYSITIPYSYNLRLLNIPLDKNQVSSQSIPIDVLSDLYDEGYRYILREGLVIIRSIAPTVDLNKVRRVWQGGCIIRNYNLSGPDDKAGVFNSMLYISLYKSLKLQDLPTPILSVIYQNSLINIHGLPGHPLIAVTRDIFGSHGFINMEGEKIYKTWN